MSASALLRPAHPEQVVAHLKRRCLPPLLHQLLIGHHITFVLLKFPLYNERFAKIHAVGILQVVHRQLG